MRIVFVSRSGKRLTVPCDSFAQAMATAWAMYCQRLPFDLYVCLLAEEALEL